MPQVAVVLVTFNRKKMLLEAIEGILKQSYRVSNIYIIDNASTDNTTSALSDSNFLTYEHIHYIKLALNIGGSGGFNYGIKLAYEEGNEWIWTMDDDIEPEKNCLEELLKYKDLSQCVNAKKVFSSNNKTQNWEQFYDFTTGRMIELNNISFKNKAWCTTNVACFEGMLIHRDLVKKIGFPKKEYFLYQDDTLYGILASRYTNVLYVNNAIFKKKIDNYNVLSVFQAYYYIRNSIWLRKDIKKELFFRDITKWEEFIFLLNLSKLTIKLFLSNFSLSMFIALVKGIYHGYK